ncbi:hypothetical protein [Phormidesmis priestleyi]
MATTLFVDFGRGIGMGNTLSTRVDTFRDIFGAGTGTDLTTDTLPMTSITPLNNVASSLDFTPLNYDFDLNGVINNNDIDALANAVVPIMQRALEPFDINVLIAAAANFVDVQNSVNANAGDPTGQFDAYVFATTVTSNGFITGGNSVGNRFRLFGEAAALDLNPPSGATTGNTHDEAALTFADNILNSVFNPPTGTRGTAAFNENLASRLAYVAVHEAFHTFSYVHTPDETTTVPQANANQRLLTSGDVMRVIFNTPEDPFIVTRFDLSTNGNTATPQNNYRLAANDPDIRLRDDNRNGIPDLAYVTRTGAFDQIRLFNAGGGIVNVSVDAFSNQARSATNLIAQTAYPINLNTDTEGGILVDASINSDEVIIDARTRANFRLRGGTGIDSSTDSTATESDLLTLQSNGLIGTYAPSANPGSGTVNYAGGAQINFSEFENVEADNIPITVNPLTLSSSSIQEGNALVLSGSFINIDTRDTHNVIINWGDGSIPTLFTLGSGQRLFNAPHQYLDDNPTGTPSDNYTITVTVTDQDGDSGTTQSAIAVSNIDPTVPRLVLDSTNINENDTVTLTGTFTDPGLQDTHIATINWGDGTTSSLPINQNRLSRTFQITHQYQDDNPTRTPFDIFPITVTVTDDDTGFAQASTAIQVNNVNPVITSFTSNANFADRARINKPVNINATFTDIGTLDTHRAFVNWGDGTPTQEVSSILQSKGYGTVQGNHIYAKGGAFTMKLTLSDDDTGEDTESTRAIIIGNSGGPG